MKLPILPHTKMGMNESDVDLEERLVKDITIKMFTMTIQQSAEAVLTQLEDSILLLSDKQYSSKIEALSEATIGQHTRHILEMFLCLEQGYVAGKVNYELRKRDILIETSKRKAIELIHHINDHLFQYNKKMVLDAGFDANSDEVMSFSTNYYREIAYNLEHTIHHMALIKIGIKEVSGIRLPTGYGVASSTLKYRSKVAEK